ncbi:MAG TPA: ABC transporter ATP-binding protein [Clostridiaceae bacterium]
MSNYAVEAFNISKKYKGLNLDKKESGIGLWIKNISRLTSNKAEGVLALNDMNFNIQKGEIFGIYGENGAGKTTLIKILSGLLYTDTGSLSINDSTNIKEIKNSISYVSTNGWMGLEWQLTTKENLIMYGNLFGLSGKQLENECDAVLKSLDMYSNRDKYISQLSAGMRQKLTIARGILINRPILYLDEPSVSLDINSAISLREYIKHYSLSKSKSIIITSHVPDDLAICNRLMFLFKGRMVALGTKDELKIPFNNDKVLNIKCLRFEERHVAMLNGISGVKNVLNYSNEDKKNYEHIKIRIDDDKQLINKIVDLFISKNITMLSIKLSEISLQEIYEYYIGGVANGKN